MMRRSSDQERIRTEAQTSPTATFCTTAVVAVPLAPTAIEKNIGATGPAVSAHSLRRTICNHSVSGMSTVRRLMCLGISPSVSDCNSGVGTGSAKGRQRPLSPHGLSGHYGAARIRLDNSPSAAKLCALRAVLWPLLAPALAQTLERLSPTHLFGEAVVAVTFGPIFLDQLEGAVMGTPLPFIQSVCSRGRKPSD
jgi:hypothetical protein